MKTELACVPSSVCIEKARPRFANPYHVACIPFEKSVFSNDLVGLNYHRWDVCKDAVKKGKELQLPIYKFLKDPLIRRFGEQWYSELEEVANEVLKEKNNP